MSYDYKYYSGADLRYPVRPKKPVLAANADSTDVRAYADLLDSYEHDVSEYRVLIEEYSRLRDVRIYELKTRLRDEYGIKEGSFNLLWDSAWESGHSEGLQRVVDEFDYLYDIAQEFASLERG